MNIKIEKYNPDWPKQFQNIKEILDEILVDLHPNIEHIGSTSVPGLPAKPIIDIAVGVNNLDELDFCINPMIENEFIYYEIYNEFMPNRRFFAKLKRNADRKNFQNIYLTNIF